MLLMATTETPLYIPASEPEELAALLAATQEPGWLDAFSEAFNQARSANQAKYVFSVWGLSLAEAGRLFGVSRQAVSRWTIDGVPSTQTEAFADLAAATEILSHYLRHDRIPAVVRRPAAALGHQSLIDLLADGDTGEIVEAVRAMFQFGDAHR